MVDLWTLFGILDDAVDASEDVEFKANPIPNKTKPATANPRIPMEESQ
jgi:hypothetical protein